MEEGVDFGTWFQRNKSTSWQGSMIARGKHGGKGRRLGIHVVSHKQQAESKLEVG